MAPAGRVGGDITGSLFPDSGPGEESASGSNGISITIKIEENDEEDEERLAAERTSAGLMIQSREELDEYFRSLPTRGPYDCPFSGCHLLRKLHFREHLFGSSRRTATCGPLRPPDKVTRRSRPYSMPKLVTDPNSPSVDNCMQFNGESEGQPLPPLLQHHPPTHGSEQQPAAKKGSATRQPALKQSIPRSVLASAPGSSSSVPHVADLTPHPRTNGVHVNGVSNGQEEDGAWIRRSTRVKKEPIDLYPDTVTPPKKRAKKNSTTSRKSGAQQPATAASSTSSTPWTTGPHRQVTTAATQTDLTIFKMSFIHIEDKKKRKHGHTS